MNLSATAYLTQKEGSKVLASASIEINGSFAVNNIAVVRTGENDLSVFMPSQRYPNRDGEIKHRPMVRAFNSAKKQIEDVVLNKCSSGNAEEMAKPDASVSKKTNLTVQAFMNHNEKNKFLALASVTLDNSLRVDGLKVVVGQDNKLQVTMPSQKFIKDGKEEYKDVFLPVTAEAQKQLKDAVLKAFEVERDKKPSVLTALKTAQARSQAEAKEKSTEKVPTVGKTEI